MKYLHLTPAAPLPALQMTAPFRAAVVVEAQVSRDWRDRVCAWLAAEGCLYMLAWGVDCSEWDDAMDGANIDAFAPLDVPANRFIMTTWHERDSLQAFLAFSKRYAVHPHVPLAQSLVLHIGAERQCQALTRAWHQA